MFRRFFHDTGQAVQTHPDLISRKDGALRKGWPQNRNARTKGAAYPLALTSFIARILFVDDINATLAANDAAVGVTLFQRLKRIGNFHDLIPLIISAARAAS